MCIDVQSYQNKLFDSIQPSVLQQISQLKLGPLHIFSPYFFLDLPKILHSAADSAYSRLILALFFGISLKFCILQLILLILALFSPYFLGFP